jgi:hypothetical protein
MGRRHDPTLTRELAAGTAFWLGIITVKDPVG